MTDYREQAIRDVAEACGVGYDDAAEWCIDKRANSVAYAVAQRERVLELESREVELLRAVSAGNEAVLDLKARVLELEAQLQPKPRIKRQCCMMVNGQRVTGSGFSPRPCRYPARWERDGKLYCGWHDPVRSAERERQQAEMIEKINREYLEAQLQQKEGERG